MYNENNCPKCNSTEHCTHVIDGFTRCKSCYTVYVTKSEDATFNEEAATLLQVLTFLSSHFDSRETFYFLELPITYQKSMNWIVFEAAAEPHDCKTYHECFVSKVLDGDFRSDIVAPVHALVHYTNNHGTKPITLANLRHWERNYVL